MVQARGRSGPLPRPEPLGAGMGRDRMGGERFAVIGLGYVGLPLAVGFARAHGRAPGATAVVGFDVRPERVAALRRGEDATLAFAPEELAEAGLRCTTEHEDLR